MASRNQQQLGLVSSVDKDCPVVGNLNSLGRIIKQISSSLSVQLLGNCDILESAEVVLNIEANPDEKKPDNASPGLNRQSALAFKREHVDLLIRQPIKIVLGRFGGLERVIDQIKQDLEKIKVPPVSTVNNPKRDN